MLLKIFTSQNSVKIIADIKDAEIHNGQYHYTSHKEIQDTISFGPGMFTETKTTPYEVEIYDRWEYCRSTEQNEIPSPAHIIDTTETSVIKFVDYKLNDGWHRVAIYQYAYLCNDEGRTIQKIGA